mmetsp:Transcript_32861/g.61608  ORF Transcript_32861/g.61608 Transcript_32861/m.61608 type:complete len:80 (-) Transcript_32861:36-275(-)
MGRAWRSGARILASAWEAKKAVGPTLWHSTAPATLAVRKLCYLQTLPVGTELHGLFGKTHRPGLSELPRIIFMVKQSAL